MVSFQGTLAFLCLLCSNDLTFPGFQLDGSNQLEALLLQRQGRFNYPKSKLFKVLALFCYILDFHDFAC